MATFDEAGGMGGFSDMLGAGAQGAPQPGSPQGLGAVVNGPDPVVQQLMNAPANPEEYTSRVAKWNQLLQDPRLQNALLFFGASATAPLGFNESPLHRGLASAATGATAYQLTDLAGQQQDQARQKIAMDQQQTSANVRRLDAGTAREEQQLEHNRELQPLQLKKYQMEFQKLEQDIASAKTLEAKRALEIKRERLMLDIEEKTGLPKAQAELQLRRAQAGQAASGAAANTALAGERQAETVQITRVNELEKKQLEGGELTPQEKEFLAQHRAKKGSTQSAQVLNRDAIRESLRRIYPGETPQQVEQRLLDLESSKKGQDLEVIKLLQNSENEALRKEADRILEKMITGKDKSAGPTPATLAPSARASLLKNLKEGQTYQGKYVKRGNEIYEVK